MRLVEAVARKLLHQFEDARDFPFRQTPLSRAADEPLALLGHVACVLLAHRAPQNIGLAKRVAGELFEICITCS